MTTHNVYSRGVVRVMKEQCDTCIFRPGNRMRLQRGRVRQMVRDAEKCQSAIICHHTLDRPEQAVCRGFFDLGPTTQTLQVAERLGVIEEVL